MNNWKEVCSGAVSTAPENLLMILLPEDLKGGERLLGHFNMGKDENELSFLEHLLYKFSGLPYENASKIIKADYDINNGFRFPSELVRDHIKDGTGGTCFSLVYLFKSLLDVCGFKSNLILADRTYGENTHTAIIIELGKELYLADPGYLLFKPIKLPGDAPVLYDIGHSTLYIEPVGNFFDVFTIERKGYKKFRYRLKNEKISREDYLEAWQKSFEFEMMNHLVITKSIDNRQIYIRNNYFQNKTENEVLKKHITTEELVTITSHMGISEKIIKQALITLGR